MRQPEAQQSKAFTTSEVVIIFCFSIPYGINKIKFGAAKKVSPKAPISKTLTLHLPVLSEIFHYDSHIFKIIFHAAITALLCIRCRNTLTGDNLCLAAILLSYAISGGFLNYNFWAVWRTFQELHPRLTTNLYGEDQ
jgi:hypothetical protein